MENYFGTKRLKPETKALYMELSDAIDRDDGDGFRAILEKFPPVEELDHQRRCNLTDRFVVMHPEEEYMLLLKIVTQGIEKYCEGRSAIERITPFETVP